MTKAERLLDLTHRLHDGQAHTAASLADELGVTLRTLRRDLATLRDQGVVVTGEGGPGGGVRLEGDRAAPLQLTIAEVVSLWLGVRLSQGASDLPWGDAASSALHKLLASLPKKKARDLRALCRRVIVGPPAESDFARAAGKPQGELLRILEKAFAEGCGLAFHYAAQNGALSIRRVEPHGLLVRAPVWYVLARDVDKSASRMFRMDRIARPRLLASLRFEADEALIWSHIKPAQPGKDWQPLIGSPPPPR